MLCFYIFLSNSNYFHTCRWDPKQKDPLQIRVELGVIPIKGHFTLSTAPKLEPQPHMQFSVISRTPFGRVGALPLCRI